MLFKMPAAVVKVFMKCFPLCVASLSLTHSNPDNVCMVPLWFAVGNHLGKFGFYLRKDPRLNKMKELLSPIYFLPVLFPV